MSFDPSFFFKIESYKSEFEEFCIYLFSDIQIGVAQVIFMRNKDDQPVVNSDADEEELDVLVDVVRLVELVPCFALAPVVELDEGLQPLGHHLSHAPVVQLLVLRLSGLLVDEGHPRRDEFAGGGVDCLQGGG